MYCSKEGKFVSWVVSVAMMCDDGTFTCSCVGAGEILVTRLGSFGPGYRGESRLYKSEILMFTVMLIRGGWLFRPMGLPKRRSLNLVYKSEKLTITGDGYINWFVLWFDKGVCILRLIDWDYFGVFWLTKRYQKFR